MSPTDTTTHAIEALYARIAAQAIELATLRADLAANSADAQVASCEGCGAPLFEGDDFVSNPDCVSGCWYAMTDLPSKRERPCYAYRVGKRSAVLAGKSAA